MKKHLNWIFGIIIVLLLAAGFIIGGRTDYFQNAVKSEYDSKNDKPIPMCEELIVRISATTMIIVRNYAIENNEEVLKNARIISDDKRVKEIINYLKKAKEHEGDINFIGSLLELELYNDDSKLIDVIRIYDTNISIQSENNRFDIDTNVLITMIS